MERLASVPGITALILVAILGWFAYQGAACVRTAQANVNSRLNSALNPR